MDRPSPVGWSRSQAVDTDGGGPILKQLALILAIVIVAILAIVAALTIVNRGADGDESADEESADDETAEPAGPATTVGVSVGADGSQVEVGCRLPVEDQSPLLVTFENRTAATDDFQAQVSVRLADGGRVTLVADAPGLRPGERRSVLPEPWLEPGAVSRCEVVAIQGSDRVIILEDG